MAKPVLPDLRGIRVLVVAEEVLIAMLIEEMLSELGVEVVGPVKSAGQGLRLLDTQTVDAVVVDIDREEDIDYGVALTLRARAIPFIFLPDYVGLPTCPDELSEAPRLRKPFSMADFGRTVAEAVSGR